MSWHNQKILTHEEVLDGVAEAVPANHNPGDECSIWIQHDEGGDHKQAIDGYVVGTKVRGMHQITYDVAVPIKGTSLYAVIEDIRGWVTNRNSKVSEGGGLVAVEELEEKLDSPAGRRSMMHVVDPPSA